MLDLGSGSGRDCYTLSKLVGEHGHVTGIDMTESLVRIENKLLSTWMGPMVKCVSVTFLSLSTNRSLPRRSLFSITRRSLVTKNPTLFLFKAIWRSLMKLGYKVTLWMCWCRLDYLHSPFMSQCGA